MEPDLLTLAAELGRRGEPFAMATVVRCERPTAVKPGAKAIVHADGTLSGWIGGACAEPTVVREALAALRDGQPRLVSLVGEGGQSPGRTEGVVQYPMTCHSGGTLEIYVEPFLPRPALLLLGRGPVLDTLAALGRATHFDVTVVDVAAPGPSAAFALTANTFVVVATHGTADEEALARALASGAVYVSLVASRRRAAAVLERLKQRGLPPERLSALKAPAGLDIGAVSPEEIAISIMAEIVQLRRSAKVIAAEPASRQAIDPVCGMQVDVASARYRSATPTGIVYFCCSSCQEQYDRSVSR